MNRRDFIRLTAGGASLLALRRFGRAQSPNLTKFMDTLPGLTSAGANNLGQYIPVASPAAATVNGQLVDFYSINMLAHSEKMHSELPPTTLWGYDDVSAPGPHYLGPAVVAKSNRPVVVQYSNNLALPHPLPVDTSLMGADGAQNRVSPHLHGGFVSWESDGGPFAWFAPDNTYGPSFTTRQFWYPNQQSARLMWYHDHAIGITRLNAYAGLAAPYVLRDDFEESLIAGQLIPGHDFEIPLVIQDKAFYADGRLRYDADYFASGAEYGPDADPPAVIANSTMPSPSCLPEFFGDTTVINGTCYPKVTLKPAVYRLRILNAAQARFYNLNLFYANANGTKADTSKPGPPLVQIATEGGFLPGPVVFNQPPRLMSFDSDGNPVNYSLLLAPAERAEVLIDLRGLSGSMLILHNDAPAPFPGGDPAEDGDAAGPDTRHLLRIDVSGSPTLQKPIDLPKLASALASRFKQSDLSFGTSNNLRRLTLNEDFDEYGRLIQRLGTDVSLGKNNQGLVTWARNYADTPTETPKAGSVETWQIYNLTGDTHPIHFHLVNVHVVSRRKFDVSTFDKNPKFTGPARRPDANELGWKETVRMNPGEVTTVEMKFDLPKVPYAVPFSPRLAAKYGLNAYEYVWHCHILEHEEHDMMRPLVIL